MVPISPHSTPTTCDKYNSQKIFSQTCLPHMKWPWWMRQTCVDLRFFCIETWIFLSIKTQVQFCQWYTYNRNYFCRYKINKYIFTSLIHCIAMVRYGVVQSHPRSTPTRICLPLLCQRICAGGQVMLDICRHKGKLRKLGKLESKPHQSRCRCEFI